MRTDKYNRVNRMRPNHSIDPTQEMLGVDIGTAAAHKGPRDEVVHEARKSLKKIRAVLRLVRPVIGER